MRDRLRSATWLIRSIHSRRRILLQVTESIMRFQRDFLDHGFAHLRSLTVRDVSEDVGMHASTVSRVTTNKCVDTPQGLYPLTDFFNRRLSLN